MYLKTIKFLVVLSVVSCYDTINKIDDTREVEEGKTIILRCRSNDEDHNFMFWHRTVTDEVIGPKSVFNNRKFKYEVLSGNLTIKSISAEESGIYSCVSDGLDKRDISVHSVNVVVKTLGSEGQEEGEIEEKPKINTGSNNVGNLWKVSAVLGSIFVFLVIVLVGLHVYHKETEKPNYFDIQQNDDDDDDSTEELFTREPSTSGLKTAHDKTSDNFEKVYTAIKMNNK